MISEPERIVTGSIQEAWRACAQLIVDSGDRFNLVVHITDPTAVQEEGLASFDPRRVRPQVKSLYDVANTIFPSGHNNQTLSAEEFLDHYAAIYSRGRSRTPTAWGTYFQRLVDFGGGNVKQLQNTIDCMNEWHARPRAAFVLHLSGAHLDTPRPLGAPCWQYGQFIRTDNNILSLSVVYRSHDYFEKALGNFLGLARLLRFVCRHTHQTPGTLTCLSIYAHLNGKRARTRELLEMNR